MKSKKNITDELIAVCKKVESKGFVAATDGNISARLSNGNILTTPTMANKAFVRAKDLVELTPEGKIVSKNKFPSSEIKMHLAIYNRRPDVNAVVHCHPVFATGFAAARVSIPNGIFPEVVLGIGEIPLAEYATPSTEEVVNSILPYVKKSNAILLSNHGVVTYGKNLWDAYFKMEKIEQIAQMIVAARMLGGEKKLSKKQIEKLSTLQFKK